jgi:hypothetical protein
MHAIVALKSSRYCLFPWCQTHVVTHHTLREKPPSQSVKSTRGRLPRVQHSGKGNRGSGSRGRGLPRVPNKEHSGKPFPSAFLPLGEDLTPSTGFFYSSPSATLGEEISFFLKPLPRVPVHLTLGEDRVLFLICPSPSARCPGTRGRPLPFF